MVIDFIEDQTKKYITLFNNYYNFNDNILKKNKSSIILLHNFNNILNKENKFEDNENEENKNYYISNEKLEIYINNLTNKTPGKKVLHKIKQITYHILNITKLLINNVITKLLIQCNIEPISKLITTLGINGLNYLLNKLLLLKTFEDLTEEEKNLLLSLSKDIKYIYHKTSKLLNEQIIKIMNSSCCK